MLRLFSIIHSKLFFKCTGESTFHLVLCSKHCCNPRGQLDITPTLASPPPCTAPAKSLQLCPTLPDPMDCSLPGSSVHGISRQEYWSGVPLPSLITLHSSVQFSCSVVSDSLGPHESQQARPPCPSPTPGVHSDSRPSSQ